MGIIWGKIRNSHWFWVKINLHIFYLFKKKFLRHLLLRSFLPQLGQNLAFSWKCSPQGRQDDSISKREKECLYKQHDFLPPKHNFSDLLAGGGGILGRPIRCVVFHGEAFDRFRFVRRSIEFCTEKLSICTEKRRRRSFWFVRRNIEFSTEQEAKFLYGEASYVCMEQPILHGAAIGLHGEQPEVHGAGQFPRSSDRFARRKRIPIVGHRIKFISSNCHVMFFMTYLCLYQSDNRVT